MDHSAVREVVAGLVLGDLDRAEQLSVQPHLVVCPACRCLERDLHEVAGEIALAAPIRPIPPELRAAVFAAIRRATGRGAG
jgi:predicted anti-sigma-YlaC factor YlaD